MRLSLNPELRGSRLLSRTSHTRRMDVVLAQIPGREIVVLLLGRLPECSNVLLEALPDVLCYESKFIFLRLIVELVYHMSEISPQQQTGHGLLEHCGNRVSVDTPMLYDRPVQLVERLVLQERYFEVLDEDPDFDGANLSTFVGVEVRSALGKDPILEGLDEESIYVFNGDIVTLDRSGFVRRIRQSLFADLAIKRSEGLR